MIFRSNHKLPILVGRILGTDQAIGYNESVPRKADWDAIVDLAQEISNAMDREYIDARRASRQGGA